MSNGTRGKWAEDKVHAWLKKEKAASATFTYNRILDARSARGAMSNPQPGDFQWFRDLGNSDILSGDGKGGMAVYKGRRWTRNGLIEVKSTEHTHLLRYDHFNVDQVARMRIRAMAGSETLVLVNFRPVDHVPYWRTAPLEYFEQRDRKGSWDMGDIDAYTLCDDLLERYLR